MGAERQRSHEALEAAPQLAHASSEIESLKSSLDDERARAAESKARIEELEAKLSGHGEQLTDWRTREEALFAELQNVKDNTQQLQWNREKVSNPFPQGSYLLKASIFPDSRGTAARARAS